MASSARPAPDWHLSPCPQLQLLPLNGNPVKVPILIDRNPSKLLTWTSLVVWWLRFRAPNTRGLGSIPSQETTSHIPQLRVHVLSLVSSVWLFATPWTVALQPPLSMGFSRQEHWSGLPCPLPGDLPDPGIKPASYAWQVDSLNHRGCLLSAFNLRYSSSPMFQYWFSVCMIYSLLKVGYWSSLLLLYIVIYFSLHIC